MLETVIYDDGFNSRTVRDTFEAMTACSNHIVEVQAMFIARTILSGNAMDLAGVS